MTCSCSLSNSSSRLFGLVAGLRLPRFLQAFVNEKYAQHFGLDLAEFRAASEYESLSALFTRALVLPRELGEGVISPCDGRVLHCGRAFVADTGEAGAPHLALAIKGHSYELNELLRGNFANEDLAGGLDYANIYLSPRDYHRYHAPCELQILSASYTPGRLFSVSEKYLGRVSNLYNQNERVSLKCRVIKEGESGGGSGGRSGGLLWLVFVGAQNVGRMKFNFDESIQTNAKNAQNFTREYEDLRVKKGEELGYFELGSTIVLLSQKGALKLKLQTGQELKFGQGIGELG